MHTMRSMLSNRTKLLLVLLYFFFQAEDGIRDKLVTGVQTCALPIFQESNRLKGEFLSTMSHEIRAPMNSIMGYGHLLLDGVAGEMSPEQAADVSQITGSAERLLRLIDNVLDLSKIEAGRMDIVAEAVDLRRLVAEVRSDFIIEAGEKHVAILT